MNVTVNTKPLRDAISILTPIANLNKSHVQQKIIRVVAQPNQMQLTARNADQQITLNLDADTPFTLVDPVETLMPAEPLPNLLKSFTSDNVNFHSVPAVPAAGKKKEEPAKLKFVSGKTKAELTTPEDTSFFQAAPEATETVTVNTQDLHSVLSSVAHACAKPSDYQKYPVLIHITKTRLRAVSTDGYRLALQDVAAVHDNELKLYIPLHSLATLMKITAENTLPTVITESADTLTFSNDKFIAQIKREDKESFPQYSRALPENPTLIIKVKPVEFRSSAVRARILSDPTRNNRVDMHVKDGTATITSSNDYGSSIQVVDVEQTGAEPELLVSFNANYLIAALEPIRDYETVEFAFHAPTNNLLITNEDATFKGLLVPLKVTEHTPVPT